MEGCSDYIAYEQCTLLETTTGVKVMDLQYNADLHAKTCREFVPETSTCKIAFYIECWVCVYIACRDFLRILKIKASTYKRSSMPLSCPFNIRPIERQILDGPAQARGRNTLMVLIWWDFINAHSSTTESHICNSYETGYNTPSRHT